MTGQQVNLKVYNTITRNKEEFKPLEGNTVKIYNCGPTVYTYAHIGNFRTFLFDDTLRRVLEYLGYEVRQVMNITDVGHMTTDDDIDAGEGEDKLQEQAKKENKNPLQIARFYEEAFLEDFDRLGLLRPEVFPRATEHIAEMIEFVEKTPRQRRRLQDRRGSLFRPEQIPRLRKTLRQHARRVARRASR